MGVQDIAGDRYFDPDDPKNQLPPKPKTEGEKLEESGEYIDTGELNQEGNPLQWQGVTYTNVEDYRKAVDASGASGRAGHTVGPAEVVAGAVLAPIVGGKAIATYGLDKTLEVGLSALFPDVQDTALDQAMRMFPKGKHAANVSKLTRGLYENIINNVWAEKRFSNPFDLPGFFNIGAGIDTGASGVKRWEQFGYGLDKVEPSQVANPRFTAAQKANVSDNLQEFYDKVIRFERTGKKAKEYPLYWINPETNDIYRVTRKRIGINRTRLHLESKNRYFRENLQSSPVQKQNISLEKTSIAEKNKARKAEILEEDFLTLRDFYKAELDKLDLMIESRGGGGKPGSARGLEAESWLASRRELSNQLDDLLEGRAEFYGEHGYNLANERIQDIVRSFPDFSLGDRKNFFPTLDKGGFKTFKDNLESIINSTNRQTGVYNYPEIVVNYNPNLHNGAEYIIRLEDKGSIRLGGPQGIYPNQLYGNLIQDIPNGIDFFNDIPASVRRAGSREGGTRAIREWLESIGITPTPDPSKVQSLRKYIPPTTRPKKTRKQSRQEILNQAIKDAGLDRER